MKIVLTLLFGVLSLTSFTQTLKIPDALGTSNVPGNVGIGEANPITKLHININSANTNFGSVSASDLSLFLKNTSSTNNNFNSISFGDAGGYGVAHIGTIYKDQTNHYGKLYFATRGSGGLVQRMIIDENGDASFTGLVYPAGGIISAGSVQSNATYGFVLAPSSAADAVISRNTQGNLVLSSGSGTSDIRLNFGYGGGSGGVSIFDGGNQKSANFKLDSVGNLQIHTFSGKVGIGTNINKSSSVDAKLTVAGDIHSSEVKVSVGAGSDFVFFPDYKLMPLQEVERYIVNNKHLPDVASAKEMESNGIELGKMDMQLLQKIEELTLYMIELRKELESIKKENEEIKSRLLKSEK